MKYGCGFRKLSKGRGLIHFITCEILNKHTTLSLVFLSFSTLFGGLFCGGFLCFVSLLFLISKNSKKCCSPRKLSSPLDPPMLHVILCADHNWQCWMLTALNHSLSLLHRCPFHGRPPVRIHRRDVRLCPLLCPRRHRHLHPSQAPTPENQRISSK